MIYWDIHTHRREAPGTVKSLDLRQPDPGGAAYFTVGIHPWHLNNFELSQIDELLSPWLTDPRCVGLGEIGLDRSIDNDWERQCAFFASQLRLAGERHLRAVIVHCVRAYSDLIGILKQSSYRGALVLHAYNARASDHRQLLTHRRIHMSFGSRPLARWPRQAELLAATPADRLFLESDDDEACDMAQLYAQAAAFRGEALGPLHAQIEANVERVFGIATIADC